MLSVDLSNIWCSVSLPDLLREEKAVFDAHMVLGGGVLKEEGFLSFVTSGQHTAMLEKILLLAQKVRRNSQYLVVVGGGLTALGVRAALSLCKTAAPGVRLIFCGEDYSARRWRSVAAQLEGADFSVLVLSSVESDPAVLIALRALRRMMEGRCGEDMQERIFVSCPEKGALYETALAEAYTLIPTPPCGGEISTLSPAGLFLMAAAGLDPYRMLNGAAAMAEKCDIRSFENPVWLYAGARLCLRQAGFRGEALLVTDPRMEDFADWWQSILSAAVGSAKEQWHLSVLHLPGDLSRLGNAALAPGRFMTMLELPLPSQRVQVEMDWKDADGLNILSGKDLSYVEKAALEAANDTLARHDIPVVNILLEREPGEQELGALLYFVELSAALCARAVGEKPFSGGDMQIFYRHLAKNLGWNFSNM